MTDAMKPSAGADEHSLAGVHPVSPFTAAADDAPPLGQVDMAALVDRTLAGKFLWLRFPRALEERFIADTAQSRLRVLLIAGVIASFMMSFFLISDYAMLPDMMDQAIIWRLWIATPICLVGMWVMSQIHIVLVRELMAVSAGVLTSLVHVYLASRSQSPHAAAYMTGLAMILLYFNVFVRTRFWLAVPSSACVMLIYLGSVWVVPNHSLALSVPVGLVLLTTAQFTLYSLYTLEYDERHSYLMGLRQRLLQRDLTHANQALERVSRFDALTQVANRRHFDDFLDRLWTRAQGEPDNEVAILMLDVDHFKAYNDRYGHPAGDACLAEVAKALRQSLRRPEDLVARYGGEEFIVVLNRTPLAQAIATAERVRAAVEALSMRHEAAFTHGKVTVSVGVATAMAQDRKASPQKLISQADEALYQAKNRGRNRVWPATGGAPA